MNTAQHLTAHFMGKLHARMLPLLDGIGKARNVQQDLRIQYLRGEGMEGTLPGADEHKRKEEARVLADLINEGVFQQVGKGERLRRIDFTERGRQYAEFLLQQAELDVLLMYVEDMYFLETETPTGMPFFDTQWFPLWMVAGLPEWDRHPPERDADLTKLNNTYMDLGACTSRGWLIGTTDADGRVYYSLTDKGREIAQNPERLPTQCKPKAVKDAIKKEFAKTYDRAKTAERERFERISTNEVAVGVPVGGWMPEGAQWVNVGYWQWRNANWPPECSECAEELNNRQALTCSPQCKQKRQDRMQHAPGKQKR